MSDIFEACMATCPVNDDDQALRDWVETWAAPIATHAEAVASLFGVLEQGVTEERLILACAVLDSMRMNHENNEPGAAEAFVVVESWAQSRTASLTTSDKMGLCQAFVRAGLPVPEPLRLGPGDGSDGMALPSAGAPDVADLLDALLPDGISGYPAFSALSEALSAMPDAPAQAFVSEMIRHSQSAHIDLGRYFLLAPELDMRRAAAEGFLALSKTGKIDAALLSHLIQIRKWMPADAAQQKLDRAIKAALRSEASGGTPPRPWRVHRMMVSLPDGTGSQSLAAAVSRGSAKAVAMLLIKPGHGIKDAYAIPCDSASEQRAMLAQIAEGAGTFDVPHDFLAHVLARALADHLPPAPGFLEVVQMLGAEQAVPESAPVSPNIIADPGGLVADLTPQKRGRMIGQSINWPTYFDIAQSWFVSDAPLVEALNKAKTERQAEKAVWAALETGRAHWTMIFARAAEVLRHADDPIWSGFAAVVLGLEAGRPLKKIPIFEMIAALTVDVAEGEGIPALQDEMEDDDDIAPEGKGEMARLLKGSNLSSDSMNGYLTAVMIAPEFTTPDVWLPPLMTNLRTKREGSMQRLLDLVMLRLGRVRDAMLDDDVAVTMREAKDLGAWLSGFDQATALNPAWPKKALSKEDRKILGLIKDGIQDENTCSTLKPLLPHWLNVLTARAME